MQSYMLPPPALQSVMVMQLDKPQIRACHQRPSSGRQQVQLRQVLAVTRFPAWSLGKLEGASVDLLQHGTRSQTEAASAPHESASTLISVTSPLDYDAQL